jgi:Zn-finger nucleic acid-binding protein
VELRIADRQGIEIDYCPQCRGVWLDRGELDKIIERSHTTSSATSRHDDDDDDELKYREGQAQHRGHSHKRKGFFGELFDFD